MSTELGNQKIWEKLKANPELLYDYDIALSTQLEDCTKYEDAQPGFERHAIYKSSELTTSYINGILEEGLRGDLEKFYNYHNIKEKGKGVISCVNDPDTANGGLPIDILTNIYEELGFYKDPKHKEKNSSENTKSMKDIIKCSDTMTSPQNWLNHAISMLLKEYGNSDFKEKLKKHKIIGTHPGTIRSSIALWLRKDGDFYKNIRNNFQYLEEFLSISHTIGNYCPVSTNFNGSRSGSYASHDFWDLTLMKIREYFVESEKQQEQILLELLHPTKKGVREVAIDEARKWFKDFKPETGVKAWKNFVTTYLFDDYVNKNTDTWEVEPLWPKHSYENSDLPSDKTDFNIALCEIIFRIRARNIRIVSELRKNLVIEKSDTEASEKPSEEQDNE